LLERGLSSARKIVGRSRLARNLAARVLPDLEAKGRQAVLKTLAAGETQILFADPSELPRGYGSDTNERVVEIPWLLSQGLRGRTLDAGSALNHDGYLDWVLPAVDELHIVTLEPERTSFPERRISYVYSDLRKLPYRDGYFDTIVSVSTLEHVGMDNRGYGSAAEQAADAQRESEAAIRELRRTLAPGGRILMTFPYGVPEDHGGWRQFDGDHLERLIAAAAPSEIDLRVYRYAGGGWQLSDLEGAADARYQLGFAAEAVACVRLSF
jgi:SAM-dependent methyltransferase